VHRYVPLGEYASTTSPFQSAGDPVVSKPVALDFTYAFAPAATFQNVKPLEMIGALPRK
jgi:hypothetical protein